MPWEKRHHSKLKRFLRHNRGFMFIAVLTLIVLALVFGVMYFMSSPNFVNNQRD